MNDSPLPPQGKDIPHYVSTEPFDPLAAEQLTPEQEKYYFASQRQL